MPDEPILYGPDDRPLDPKPISENNTTPNTQRESNVKAQDSNQNIQPTSCVPTAQVSEAHHKITCKIEKDRWDKFKPYVEVAGVVVLFIYTLYTIKMYCANKQAADAATSAARTADNTLKSTLRPRLMILGATGLFDVLDETIGTGPNQTHHSIIRPSLDDGRLSITLDLHNYGPLPAKNVRFFRFDAIGHRDHFRQMPYVESEGKPRLFPPRPDIGGVSVQGINTVTLNEINGLKDGSLDAAFSVLITYDLNPA